MHVPKIVIVISTLYIIVGWFGWIDRPRLLEVPRAASNLGMKQIKHARFGSSTLEKRI